MLITIERQARYEHMKRMTCLLMKYMYSSTFFLGGHSVAFTGYIETNFAL